MIDDRRWLEIDSLFERLLDVPVEQRADELRRATNDPEVREQVASLLAQAESEDDFLKPAGALDRSFVASMDQMLDDERKRGPIDIGSRLGSYEITGLLGRGGMGAVYRATDHTLGREVAIKVLSGGLSEDSLRLQRLEREARALATLNHPNIAGIFGLERHGSEPYLILELLEGETLREALSRGPLPMGQAIEIALQVASGLEAAHARGLVHRDLKPDNIKIGGDQAKILDFGLAKPTQQEESDSDWGHTATRTGVILGTAFYMSPEQARGQRVDPRTDVWAFGCVLYEMLSGRRPFSGTTPSDVLASILKDEPDLGRLPPETPLAIERIIRRCLRKDGRRRLQSIGDARVEIEEWLDHVPAGGLPGERREEGWLGRLAPWVIAAVASGVAVAAWFVLQPERLRSPSPPSALMLSPEPGVSFSDHYTTAVSASPDGRHLVYAGVDAEGIEELYVRSLDSLDARKVEGSVDGRQPFFSPDGEWLGFQADRKLMKVRFDGGSPIVLNDVGGNLRGASWSMDDVIVLAPTQTSPLAWVPADGGVLQPLTELDVATHERSHRWPQFLPDGQRVLFTVQYEGKGYDEAVLKVVDLEGGEPVLLIEGAHGRIRGDTLFYVRGGRLYRVGIDLNTLKLRGAPEVALEGVKYDSRNGGAQFSVAEPDLLVYRPGPPLTAESRPVWFDREGGRQVVDPNYRVFSEPRLSADSTQMVVRIGRGGEARLWRFDLQTASLTRLSDRELRWPVWHPSGEYLVAAGLDGLWVLDAQGVGEERRLTESTRLQRPGGFSPDGELLVYQEQRTDTGWDVLAVLLDYYLQPQGVPAALFESPANETNARISPDGQFIAYESDELDSVVQIYVRSFPDLSKKWQITHDGARWPQWSPDGGELFHWMTGRQELVVTSFAVEGAEIRVQEETTLLRTGSEMWRTDLSGIPFVDPGNSGFTVATDGRRLLMLEPRPVPEVPYLDSVVVARGVEGL